jgi:hypothetical protein
MKIRLRPSTFLIDLGPLGLILHWMDRIFPSLIMQNICVIFDKRITWRLHTEMIETKAFRIFIRIYCLLKSEVLNMNIKLTLHKVLIRSVMIYACPTCELAVDTWSLKIAVSEKQGSLNHWKCSKVHTGPLFAYGFQPSVCIRLYRGHFNDLDTFTALRFTATGASPDPLHYYVTRLAMRIVHGSSLCQQC